MKDIKKGIVGLCISTLIIAIGLAIVITGIYLKIPIRIVRDAVEVLVVLATLIGFAHWIIFFIVIIEFATIKKEHSNDDTY